MPQLNYLCIGFCLNTPTQDVGGQLLHAPVTYVMLPCLKTIFIIGDAAYMEGLAARISNPLLGEFGVTFFNQSTFSLPRLSQFLWAAKQLRLPAATVMFGADDTASIYMVENEKDSDLKPLPLFTPFQVKIQGRTSLASGRLMKELSCALQPDDPEEGPSGVEFLPALRKILRPCRQVPLPWNEVIGFQVGVLLSHLRLMRRLVPFSESPSE